MNLAEIRREMKKETRRNQSQCYSRAINPKLSRLGKWCRGWLVILSLTCSVGCLEARRTALVDPSANLGVDEGIDNQGDDTSLDMMKLDQVFDRGEQNDESVKDKLGGATGGQEEVGIRTLVPEGRLNSEDDEHERWGIKGRLSFYDRVYDALGFEGTYALREAPYVAIEVVRTAHNEERLLASGVTKMTGEFFLSWSGDHVKDFIEGDAIILRAVSIQETAKGHRVEVRSRLSGELYGLEYELSLEDFQAVKKRSEIQGVTYLYDVGRFIAPREGVLSGVMNILTMTALGYQLIEAHSDQVGPVLTISWDLDRPVPCGSCYVGDEILLGGQPEDPDHYDDHIILHEMGHFFTDRWSIDSSPGGPHRGRPVEPTLAYGEGVAYFWAAMILNDPVIVDWMVPRPWVVDLERDLFNGMPVTTGLFNEVNPATDELVELSAAHHEEVVSTLMWDLYDERGEEGKDRLELGEAFIMWSFLDGLVDYFERGYDVGARGVDLSDWLVLLSCQSPDLRGAELRDMCIQREYPWSVEPTSVCGLKGDAKRLMIEWLPRQGLWLPFSKIKSSAVGDSTGSDSILVNRWQGRGSQWRHLRPVKCHSLPCQVMTAQEVKQLSDGEVVVFEIEIDHELSILHRRGSWINAHETRPVARLKRRFYRAGKDILIERLLSTY